MRRAVILLSGGLDSATCLAIARDAGYECHALSFDYGQRQRRELDRAARLARALGAASHRVVRLGLDAIGGSALTDPALEVPKDRPPEEVGGAPPITYVPARNTIFLSVALALAEALGAEAIYVGVNTPDSSGYPDCRPEFLEAFAALARVATAAGLEGKAPRIEAPLLRLRKAEIIRWGLRLGVDYAMTQSCYDPVGEAACGRCDACQLRRRGFEEAGVPDPTVYARSA
ncbi:MAG TPA: 7-cyano-7-deazaguanine synthase QueC [Fredinandcohnia sp.]|nr:7-cyano-7-deazaguanine synthase QueC [Fredinandcohnia sp.]